MKTKILLGILIGFVHCITTNINQPPYVVEKTTPNYYPKQENNKEKNSNTDDSYRSRSLSNLSEEEFFDEISKQDPYLDIAQCKKCPDSQPPGYIESIPSVQPSKPNTEQTEKPPIHQENSAVVIVNSNPSTNEVSTDKLIGIASWYGKDFDGRPTASGEIFDSRKLTAAHPNLPLGTVVNVKNLENNREVILRINDRGPFVKNRILDVSEYAAELLDFKSKGLAKVQIEIIKKGDLKEKGEGTTAFFYKEAQSNMGSSPYEKSIEKKKQEVLPKIIPYDNFKSYSVQIGNFTDLRNVIRIKEEIEQKIPYPVFVLQRDQEFLIRVGSFSERYSAELLKQKLEEAGYRGFIAVP
ncbi:MAG: septal ring lytic transglycosylase RlpA family protein [Leptonema sp. (in: bacteria)]